MSEISKQALKVDNNQSFPNNNTGYITPARLRDFNTNMIDSLVDEISYNADSASWNSSIDALQNFSSSLDTNFASQAEFNSYTQSNDAKVNSLINATSSFITEAESGSFLVTASFDNGTRNLTFTKGDATTFAVNIPDVSGSTGDFVTTSSFNAFTQSADARLDSLEAATSSYAISSSVAAVDSAQQAQIDSLIAFTGSVTASVDTGSFLITASVSVDDITFTKGDGSQFTLQIATGSSAVSASYAETSSIARNVVITARNGNASTLPIGTVVHITSAVGDNPIFNTASYDTELLSSNTLGILRQAAASGTDVEVVVQGTVTGINTNPALGYAAGDVLYLSSSGQFTNIQPQAPNQIVTLGQVLRAQQNNGSMYVSINNGWELNELHNVQITSPQTNELLAYESASYGLWKNKSISTLGLATTGSNTFNGNQTINGAISASNDITGQALYLNDSINNGKIRFATGSGYFNIQLIPNDGDLAFSRDGVSNVKVMTLGGSAGKNTTFQNNPVVFQDTVGSVTLSVSSSVRGTFDVTGQSGGDGRAILLGHSGSLVVGNSAANTYYGALSHISSSQANANTNLIFKNSTATADTIVSGSANIFANPAAPTAGFKRYVGQNSNIYTHGSSVPQISGSMGWSPSINGNIFSHTQTNALTFRGPSTITGAGTINHNIFMGGQLNIGTDATNNAEKLAQGITVASNAIFSGNINVVASKTTLVAAPTISGNLLFGAGVQLNHHSSSALSYASNIQNGGITINNEYEPNVSSIASSKTVRATLNTMYGHNHVLDIKGTNTSTSQTKQFYANIFAGMYLSASIGTGDNCNILATGMIGNSLIFSGSSTAPNSNAGYTPNDTQGSLMVGRFNALDGKRASTAETVFAVGTGTAANRKTGLLIDSGSNTYVEGSLNVSGSTAMTGSATISQTLTLGSVDPLPAGTTGMLAVSQSLLWFYDATQWRQVSLI